MGDLEFLAHHMYVAILAAALAELILFWLINRRCDQQSVRLSDFLENLVKPFPDKPDTDSNQSFHDRLGAILSFVEQKSASGDGIKLSVARVMEQNRVSHTYRIEQMVNIASAMVQIFPLLGILGTILGLGQVTVGAQGAIRATDVTRAFVGSINATVLGVFFAIVFMLLEAHALAKVKRTMDEAKSVMVLASNGLKG